MRLIGHLAEEKSARIFADYLYVQKIESHVEFEKPDGWGIWINDEDKLEEAAKLLTAFRLNPADPKYRAEAKSAAELRAEAEKDEAKFRKKLLDRRYLFRPLRDYGFGPLTFVLIAISVVVCLLSRLGSDLQPILGLFITDSTTMQSVWLAPARNPPRPGVAIDHAHLHSFWPASHPVQYAVAARSGQHDRGPPIVAGAGRFWCS